LPADPITDLDPTFSPAGAVATPWSTGRARLTDAQVYWLTTVRPDGRPHVTPLLFQRPTDDELSLFDSA